MPKQVLIEVIAGFQPIAENTPTVACFYLLLGRVDGAGLHVIYLTAIDLNFYQLGFTVFMIDAIACFEISSCVNMRRGEVLLLNHPQITDALQCKNRRSLSRKRLGYQILTLLPSLQKTRYQLMMNKSLLVERMIVKFHHPTVVDSFEDVV